MNQSKTLQNMFAYLSAAMLSICAVTSSSAQIGAMLGGGLAFNPFSNEVKLECKLGKTTDDQTTQDANYDLKKFNSYVSGDIFAAFVYIMNTNYVNVMLTFGAEMKFPQKEFGIDKDAIMIIVSESFGAFVGVGVMSEKIGHVILRLCASRRNYGPGTSSEMLAKEIKSVSKWVLDISLQTCLYLIKQSFVKFGPAVTLGYAFNGKQEHTVDLSAYTNTTIEYSKEEKITTQYNPFTVKVGVIAVLTF